MRRTAFDLNLLISRQPRHGPPAHAPTPAKTPDQDELEYLDVFDFFNVPRLALGGEGAHEAAVGGQEDDAGQPKELDNGNFMVDASNDWLFKQEHAYFEGAEREMLGGRRTRT